MTAYCNSSPKPARRRLIGLAAFACAAALGSSAGAQATDWPMVNLNYGATRYSPLDQITTANVGQLKVAWVYHLKPAGAAAAPAAAPANGRPRFAIRRGACRRPAAGHRRGDVRGQPLRPHRRPGRGDRPGEMGVRDPRPRYAVAARRLLWPGAPGYAPAIIFGSRMRPALFARRGDGQARTPASAKAGSST